MTTNALPLRTGLYLHWPYCTRICPYCDFNVARNRDVDVEHWRAVLFDDITFWSERLGRRALVSIYFGGGTPSLMPVSLVQAVLEKVAACFDVAADAELTLEVNPTDAERGRLSDMRSAGINRVSIGVQSFDDTQLAFLGRNHNGAEALRTVEESLALFGRASFDLIYALPGEGVDAWADRLSHALDLGSGHLSLYQLTIEQETAFSKAVSRGDWAPPDSDEAAALYEATLAVTDAAGVPAYEVSSFAAPGHGAVHNALYWDDEDWIGIGPGAHGRLSIGGDRLATVGEPDIRSFRSAPAPGDRYSEETLTLVQRDTERLAGGLRPLAGMPVARLSARARMAIENGRKALTAEGLLLDDPDRLVVSPLGRLLIDAIAGNLAAQL